MRRKMTQKHFQFYSSCPPSPSVSLIMYFICELLFVLFNSYFILKVGFLSCLVLLLPTFVYCPSLLPTLFGSTYPQFIFCVFKVLFVVLLLVSQSVCHHVVSVVVISVFFCFASTVLFLGKY